MLMIDTCVLSRIVDGRYRPCEPFHLSALSNAEGLRIAGSQSETLYAPRILALLEGLENARILPFEREEGRIFARVAPHAFSRSRIVDAMIAATAIRWSATLVTSDAGMARLQSGLPDDLRFSVHRID